jgi:uncharacterized protein YkwD
VRVSRRRLEFRLVLGILLVWSAWPTVAGALAGTDAAPTAARALASSTTTTRPTIVSTSTTVSAPPPSTVSVPAAAPPTDPPAPPSTDAPAPATDPPAASVPATPPAPEPDAVAASPPNLCDAAVGDIVQAMNADRAASGIGPLCGNAQLTGIAQTWADHLAQTKTFEHQDLLAAIMPTPFRIMAENLLVSSHRISAQQMEAAWMASEGHREHILDGRYTYVGVGIATADDGRVFVAVDFGGEVMG